MGFHFCHNLFNLLSKSFIAFINSKSSLKKNKNNNNNILRRGRGVYLCNLYFTYSQIALLSRGNSTCPNDKNAPNPNEYLATVESQSLNFEYLGWEIELQCEVYCIWRNKFFDHFLIRVFYLNIWILYY